MNFDLSRWHSGCGIHQLVSDGQGKLFVYCPLCGVIADVEAISAKVSPADACRIGSDDKPRVELGKQSPNVDRGAVV